MKNLRRLVRVGAVLSVVVAGSVLAVSPPAHAADPLPPGFHLVTCGAPDAPGSDWSMIHLDSDLIVSAELGYSGGAYGEMRARSYNWGPWERFNFSCPTSSTWAIQGYNNLYVSTELGYGGGAYALLRDRASAIGPWEQYYLYHDTDPNTADNGDWVIQSTANGQYVTSEENYPDNPGDGDPKGALRAARTAVGPWELWSLIYVG